jgi:hypothetical protein
MTSTIDTHCWMDFPKEGDNRIIQGILRRMNSRYRPTSGKPASSPLYWEAESFGLQNVSLFQRAALGQQKAILQGLSLMLLREAFAIERAGMAFAAKMVLLSDDLDARILYSQFAAQEAEHYQMIASHIQGEPSDLDQDPFLGLLKNAIEEGDRMTLTLVIQVLLEGWGLLHYRKLQKDCVSESLSRDLKQILADEAHHHGSGVALFDEARLTNADHCRRVLQKLLAMVRMGPVGLLHELSQVLGPLDTQQTMRVMDELNHPEQSSQKLMQLRGILKNAGAVELLDSLESSFDPFTSHEVPYA